MNKKSLTSFLIKARSKTYAGNSGRVEPLLIGSNQFEFKQGDWLYRDVYNNGNGIFVGLETIYLKNTPVWSMSYFGNYKKLTEKEVDQVLREALIDKKDTARLWGNVEYKSGGYSYKCAGYGSVDELGGSEKLFKKDKEVYVFFYAGGTLIK